jgi:hypothetical protein
VVHLIEEICIDLIHVDTNTEDCKISLEFHEKSYGFKLAQVQLSLIAVHRLATSVGSSITGTCIIKLNYPTVPQSGYDYCPLFLAIKHFNMLISQKGIMESRICK